MAQAVALRRAVGGHRSAVAEHRPGHRRELVRRACGAARTCCAAGTLGRAHPARLRCSRIWATSTKPIAPTSDALRTYPDVSPFAPAWVCVSARCAVGRKRAGAATRIGGHAWYRTRDRLPAVLREGAGASGGDLISRQGRAARRRTLLAPVLDSGDPEVVLAPRRHRAGGGRNGRSGAAARGRPRWIRGAARQASACVCRPRRGVLCGQWR